MNALLGSQTVKFSKQPFSHAEERIRRRGVTSKVCLGQTNSSLILASEDQPKGTLFILDRVSWKFRRKLKRVLDPQK